MPTSVAHGKLQRPHREGRHSGFTLLETLIALSLLALAAAVSLPSLSRRIDSAFRDADLAVIVAQIQELPLRCAQLGNGCTLNDSNWSKPLPDGRPALSLPPGWALMGIPKPLHVGRAGVCSGAHWRLQPPDAAAVWSLHVQPVSCSVELRPDT